MKRNHCSRCVIAAVSAGGRTIDNYTARFLLKSRCGVKVPAENIMRDGSIRPVWDGDDSFYIPYTVDGKLYEKKSGSWVDEVKEEEAKLRRDEEILPFFNEWSKEPMKEEAAGLRDELMEVISKEDYVALDAYSIALCRDAFLGGFRAACNIILPEEAGKGVHNEA